MAFASVFWAAPSILRMPGISMSAGPRAKGWGWTTISGFVFSDLNRNGQISYTRDPATGEWAAECSADLVAVRSTWVAGIAATVARI